MQLTSIVDEAAAPSRSRSRSRSPVRCADAEGALRRPDEHGAQPSKLARRRRLQFRCADSTAFVEVDVCDAAAGLTRSGFLRNLLAVGCGCESSSEEEDCENEEDEIVLPALASFLPCSGTSHTDEVESSSSSCAPSLLSTGSATASYEALVSALMYLRERAALETDPVGEQVVAEGRAEFNSALFEWERGFGAKWSSAQAIAVYRAAHFLDIPTLADLAGGRLAASVAADSQSPGLFAQFSQARHATAWVRLVFQIGPDGSIEAQCAGAREICERPLDATAGLPDVCLDKVAGFYCSLQQPLSALAAIANPTEAYYAVRRKLLLRPGCASAWADRSPALRFAAESGNAAALGVLLSVPSMSLANPGEPPGGPPREMLLKTLNRFLPVAAQRGHLSVVRTLLQAANRWLCVGGTYGPECRLPVKLDRALLAAAEDGQASVAEELLANKADPNTKSTCKLFAGDSVLQMAAEDGDVEMVRVLLRHRANVQERNAQGLTALQLARREQKREVVALLLAH